MSPLLPDQTISFSYHSSSYKLPLGKLVPSPLSSSLLLIIAAGFFTNKNIQCSDSYQLHITLISLSLNLMMLDKVIPPTTVQAEIQSLFNDLDRATKHASGLWNMVLDNKIPYNYDRLIQSLRETEKVMSSSVWYAYKMQH